VTELAALDLVGVRLEERGSANERFFEAEAERTARLCREMADRFGRGGRLLALGRTPAARSDVRHVAVEFVHPVIVGKRALPAIGLDDPLHVGLLAEGDDIAMAFDSEAETREALALVRERGGVTIGYADVGAEWEFEPPSADPFVRQELAETHYHVLWELVHVFFEHQSRTAHDTGASSFLYPFLGEREAGAEGVVDDVRRSVLMKAEEVGDLRRQTLTDGREALVAAAASLRSVFDAGGKLLALGNGGSATDAMDAVADFRSPPREWRARPALDLTEDPAILTAIANDIGVEEIFQRQVIAYGRPGDALLALSTSGNSGNVIEALAEAGRRGLVTVAMVGYDGGRVAAESLADHVVVTRSEHIPRIQEAQASAYHALRELVEVADSD
jgi:D-sedoheptulose 7-phosphate isomerase